MSTNKNADSMGPRSRIAERIVKLAQSRPDGVVPVWLVYTEDHYETLLRDGDFAFFEFATLVRDDAYEWAWRGHEKEGWHLYKVYRALLCADTAGTLTLESLECDAGIPGKNSVPDGIRWTTEQWLEALEKSESEPPIAVPGRAHCGHRTAKQAGQAVRDTRAHHRRPAGVHRIQPVLC